MLANITFKIRKMMTPSKYRLLKQHSRKHNNQQAYLIINNELQNIISQKKPPSILNQFYSIKTIVDYNFRRYGAIQMNIANQIKIVQSMVQAISHQNQNYENPQMKQYNIKKLTQKENYQMYQSLKEFLNMLHCQMMLIWQLSDHKKLKQYLENRKTGIIPKIQHQNLAVGGDFMYKLIKAISFAVIGNQKKCFTLLLQLLNSEQGQMSQKQLIFLSLIVLKGLELQKNPNKYQASDINKSSQILMMKIIKNLNQKTQYLDRHKFSQKDFQKVNVQYCLNTWLSYLYDTPVQYSDTPILNQFVSVVHFLAQSKFLQKKYFQSKNDMNHLCQNTDINYSPLREFLQFSKLYDTKNYQQLIFKAQQRSLKLQQAQFYIGYPQWDKTNYDLECIIKKTYEHLKKKGQQANKNKLIAPNKEQDNLIQDKILQIQEQLQIFKHAHQIDTSMKGIPWYFFPSFHRILFKWPAQISPYMQGISINRNVHRRRPRSKAQKTQE